MHVSKDSFAFSGVDMLATYGIRGIVRDVIKPRLRARQLAIPGRSGTYDFSSNYYDERKIVIDCDSRAALSRAQIRELAYLLSSKGPLVLWDEPDKYYMGRVYDAAELFYLGRIGHEFTLTFCCEPFAYGQTISGPMPEMFDYAGTAQTPTRIQITNTGTESIVGLTMRIRERRE